MAFIRWKKNKFGMRHAYLVHSYRDEQGQPRHKTLAYLGQAGDLNLTPEKLAALKEQHSGLKVDWEKISPPRKLPEVTDVSQLDAQQLLSRLRKLRIERRMNMKTMISKLHALGAPIVSDWRKSPINKWDYSVLEGGWAEGRTNSHYVNSGQLLEPFIRKALES
jgi:hypothetical protein